MVPANVSRSSRFDSACVGLVAVQTRRRRAAVRRRKSEERLRRADARQRARNTVPRRGYACRSIRARGLSLVMSPTSRPLRWGIVVAIALIVVETLLAYPLRHVAPEMSLGVVYLLGVLVVSLVWGLPLGALTAVLSTAAFDYFHVPPTFDFIPRDHEAPAALTIFLAVALLLGSVAALARSRAIEAERRRREADLGGGMARLLL
jgi:K+-sensing histidine kinase KdpD